MHFSILTFSHYCPSAGATPPPFPPASIPWGLYILVWMQGSPYLFPGPSQLSFLAHLHFFVSAASLQKHFLPRTTQCLHCAEMRSNAFLNIHQKSLFQELGTDTESHSWTMCREWETIEYSDLNGMPPSNSSRPGPGIHGEEEAERL